MAFSTSLILLDSTLYTAFLEAFNAVVYDNYVIPNIPQLAKWGQLIQDGDMRLYLE